MADAQATEMERESVNKFTRTNRENPKPNFKHRKGKQMSIPNYPSCSTRQTQCRNCGGQFPHRNGTCPANGKTCNACHKQNHFAKVCHRKQNKYKSKQHTNDRRVNEIQSETTKRETCHASLDSSDEEYSYSIR